MKLDLAIRRVRDSEHRLGQELNAVGERHKADHDVFHVTGTLQSIVQANLERLAPHGERHGVDVDPDGVPADHGTGLIEKARERTSELIGRRPEPALLLLRDLRELHLLYAETSVDYVILGQGAQAAKERELLDACSQCHAQTLRGMKWTLTRIKQAAPQVLTS